MVFDFQNRSAFYNLSPLPACPPHWETAVILILIFLRKVLEVSTMPVRLLKISNEKRLFYRL